MIHWRDQLLASDETWCGYGIYHNPPEFSETFDTVTCEGCLHAKPLWDEYQEQLKNAKPIEHIPMPADYVPTEADNFIKGLLEK